MVSSPRSHNPGLEALSLGSLLAQICKIMVFVSGTGIIHPYRALGCGEGGKFIEVSTK